MIENNTEGGASAALVDIKKLVNSLCLLANNTPGQTYDWLHGHLIAHTKLIRKKLREAHRRRTHDVLWRKPEQWSELVSKLPKDVHSVLLLIETRRSELSIEEVYPLGGVWILNAPLETFRTDAVDEVIKTWKRFAVLGVARNPKDGA